MTTHLDQLIDILTVKEKSVFLTGGAGTGKTYNTNKLYDILSSREDTIGVGRTATTGLAAQLVKGQTLHSYLGLPVFYKMDKDRYPARDRIDQYLRIPRLSAIAKTEFLIIDEVSMLDDMTFDLVYWILKRVTTEYADIQVSLRSDPELSRSIDGMLEVIVSAFSQLNTTRAPVDPQRIYAMEYLLRRGTEGLKDKMGNVNSDLGDPEDIKRSVMEARAEDKVPSQETLDDVSGMIVDLITDLTAKKSRSENIRTSLFITAVEDIIKTYNQRQDMEVKWKSLKDLASRSFSGYTRLILVGDLFQLPPIISKGQEALLRNYIVYSPAFVPENVEMVQLTENRRQSDVKFTEILQEVRHGDMSEGSKKAMEDRRLTETAVREGYIELMNSNKDVNAKNELEMSKLTTESMTYVSQDYCIVELSKRELSDPDLDHGFRMTNRVVSGRSKSFIEFEGRGATSSIIGRSHEFSLVGYDQIVHPWKSEDSHADASKRVYAFKTDEITNAPGYVVNIPREDFKMSDKISNALMVGPSVTFKIGARVILMKNSTFKVGESESGKFSNGRQGTVTELLPNHVRVLFDPIGDETDPIEVSVKPTKFTLREGYETFIRSQLPLRAAYAITIHKSQGMTLDKGIVRLDRDNLWHKSPGMAYVALSRFEDLDKLYIRGSIYYPGVVTSKVVKKFYDGKSITREVNHYNRKKYELLGLPAPVRSKSRK